jgi:3-mercaptopyruvate sulfurtransferase SseA
MRTLLFSMVVALAAVGCSEKSNEKAGKAEVKSDLPEISIADAAAGLEAKNVTFVDCNNEKTRKKVGVIPGAILIDDEETFTADDLPPDKNTKLVFYCGGPG